MYSKKNIADTVLTAIKGGLLSDDIDITSVDVIGYLPAAINAAVTESVRQNSMDKIRKDRNATFKVASNPLNSTFIGTFCEKVSYDDKRCLKYVQLSKRVMALPDDVGLNDVRPLSGKMQFHKMNNQNETIDLAEEIGITSYWFEQVGGTHRVYFDNLSPMVDEVLIRMATDAADYEDDELLPLAENVALRVIELATDYYLLVRNVEEDTVSDGTDIRK